MLKIFFYTVPYEVMYISICLSPYFETFRKSEHQGGIKSALKNPRRNTIQPHTKQPRPTKTNLISSISPHSHKPRQKHFKWSFHLSGFLNPLQVTFQKKIWILNKYVFLIILLSGYIQLYDKDTALQLYISRSWDKLVSKKNIRFGLRRMFCFMSVPDVVTQTLLTDPFYQIQSSNR